MSNSTPLPAIIVDYDLYVSSLYIRETLKKKADRASFILVDSSDTYSPMNPIPEINVEFDVVIKNTGHRDDLTFKVDAFDAISRLSNHTVVWALDDSVEVQEFYEDAGVLFVGGSW